MSKSCNKLIIGVLAVILLALQLVSTAKADITVSDMIIDFSEKGSGRNSQFRDVEVRNSGTERVYVKADIYEIENPGLKTEKRIQLTGKAGAKVITSPSKFILEPGASQKLRVLNNNIMVKSDKIYRLAMLPSLEIADGKTVEVTDKISVALKMLVSYEVLVIVRPQMLNVKLDAVRKGREVTLTNTGNTNTMIRYFRQCDANGKCFDTAGARVYPGATAKVILRDNGPAEYVYMVGDSVKKAIVK